MAQGKSWAAVAETARAPEPAAAPEHAAPAPGRTVAVLDANVIIGGCSPVGLAEELVTTPDVHAEVRDAQSKQALATLPFGIAVQEPGEESLAAVLKFARATGEIHSLSTADVRLLALAHTLHAARHGPGSLRSEPPPPRAVKRGKQGGRQLPGWGATGSEWEVLDNMDEAAMRAYEEAQGASASRIAADIHVMSLAEGPAQPGTPSQGQEQPTAAAADDADQEPDAQPELADARADAGAGDSDSDSDSDSGGEWEVAAVSQLAARRRRKKELRRAARAAAASSEASWQQQAQQAGSAAGQEQEGEEQEGGDSGSGSASESCSGSDSEGSGAGGGAPSEAEGRATVVVATADFAMQNVALQMGLRLVSPDGRRVTRISRWALRCSACFKVTKEAERLFCPSCGNAALQKVEVVVGEGGAEQYGVRKRHIIRGTKFPLPKPRGGKRSKDPILREDVLLQRMPRRRPKESATDPFAPEFSAATWHDLRGSGPSTYHRGVAASLAAWKHNPNERRHARTNRRK